MGREGQRDGNREVMGWDPAQFLARFVCSGAHFNSKNSSPRLVVPNKGYSSLDQSPDEKPLVALDTDRCVWGLGAAGQAI